MAVTRFKNLRDPVEADIPKLDANPKYRVAVAELAALEGRLAEAEKRQRVAEARRRGHKPTASLADRAAALVSGGSVTAFSADAEHAAADEERAILRAAIFEQRAKVDALVGELSFEVCKRLAPLNAEALVNALLATQSLFDALESNRVLRSRILTAGYQLNSTAMPTHIFPAACTLGDPDRVGLTAAATFKSWLAANGII